MRRNDTTTQARQLPALRFLTAADEQPLALRTPAELRLADRREQLIARSRRADLSVQYLHTMPLPAGPLRYVGETTDVVLLDCMSDPLFHDLDGFPIPRHVLGDLKRIQRRGLTFDALYIAHEVPHGSAGEHGPVPAAALMPPPPRAVVQRSAQLGHAATTMWGQVGRFVQWLARTPAHARDLAEEIRTTDWRMALDPVILGVITATGRPPRSGEMVAWFYLAHWVYGAES